MMDYLNSISLEKILQISIPYLHYLSFMLCFTALTVETLTLKKDLSLQDSWKIVIADAVYGISAVTILITGVLRVLYFGKGTYYYLNNPFFYIKASVFLVVGLLSIYPTVSFISWVKNLLQNQSPELEVIKIQRLNFLIRVELLGFILIPLLATIMARY